MRHYQWGKGKWVFIDWMGIWPGYGTDQQGRNLPHGFLMPYGVELRAQMREIRHRQLERADVIARGLASPRMNPSACFRYNRLCPFFDACKGAEPGLREGIIQSRLATGQWVEKAWDFTKRDA